MKCYRLKDAPVRAGDAVFRESWVNKLIGFLIILAMCGWPMAMAVHARSWWGGLLASFFLLFPMLFWSMLRHALRSTNWLVRCRHEGLLIKFRSYQNDHYPDSDIVVFELRPDEIAWAGCTRETVMKPGHAHSTATKETVTSIDIKPKAEDLSELEARLREERARPAAGKWVKSKTHDYPVRVIEGGVIRITWRGQSNWVTPPARQALESMAKTMRTEIRPEQKIFKDLVTDPGVIAERERMVLELAERGEMIEAVKLVRKLYGGSLAEAKQFVEELTGKAEAKTGERKA